jgi:putative ABC transport system substrate-binding protein
MIEMFRIPRCSIAVRFTPVSGIDSRSQALPGRANALGSRAQRNVQALIIAGDALFLHAIKKLASLAVQHRIAEIFTARQYAQAGGLMTYGASVADSFRQAGVYAGRILRGEKPGDLPVMQPTRFELVINLQAAKAISLDVPPLLQQLADEVIE